ncbi:ankyrin [Annulohypoxylon maeteangense]|uniref:ankyrin n=1 Tax=Annulohypoxylon maeteangense TaxID=1927788 RepID=UPI0020075077|nr:ankyrin [Annulohypoxylon maeteangense]KAI0883015.1 ankyrin [Annulohypoxylon maeteangense]
MPSILSLPVEMISYIIDGLGIRDLSAFSRSCRSIHNIVTPYLYRYFKDNVALMCWAVDEGRRGTVERLLAAGADPDAPWYHRYPRPRVLAELEKYEDTMRFPNPSRCVYDVDVIFPFNAHEYDEYDDEISYHNGYGGSDGDSDGDGDSEDIRPTGNGAVSELYSRYCWTPLHIAARWGDDDLVDLLIRYGADVDAWSKGFCDCVVPSEILGPTDLGPLDPDPIRDFAMPIWTPLHTAICHGHESTARLLISRGASVNVSPWLDGPDPSQATALHSACYSDQASIARFLVDEGHQTDVEVEDYFGSTPMTYAYFARSWRAIDFLVEAGASLNATLGPFTLLKHACHSCRFAEALRFIELGVDLAASESSRSIYPILHSCCRPPPMLGDETSQEGSRTVVVRALIKAGADLEARDIDSATPLIKASLMGLDDLVKIFLDAGADIDARDDDGDTALLKACDPTALFVFDSSAKTLRTVTALLGRIPPNTDLFDVIGRICDRSLGSRLDDDRIELVRLLVHHGGQATLESRGGHMLIARALASGNVPFCDTLLKHGFGEPTLLESQAIIDKAIERDDARALEYVFTRLSCAEILKGPGKVIDLIKADKLNCASFLIKAGVPLDYRSDDGKRCLIEACKVGRTDVARLLLEKGVDPNADVDGTLPLLVPTMEENAPLITLLLEHGADMHWHPECVDIDERILGPLDVAIYLGLSIAVRVMVNHVSYLSATKEQRVAHLQNACCASSAAYADGIIIKLLLRDQTVDPDTVFPRMNMTPLHVSMALDRMPSVIALLEAGAYIHYELLPVEPPLPDSTPNPFVGTTPLEWAVDVAPFEFVKIMIEASLFRLADKPDMFLRYARAACRRYKPEIMKLLLDNGLDPHVSDEEGNSLLSIFCQTIDKIWPIEDPEWPAAARVAVRSARCVSILLEYKADQHKKNNKGVCALNHIRRMMAYEGSSEFHQEVARWWNRELIYDETGVRPGPEGPWTQLDLPDRPPSRQR